MVGETTVSPGGPKSEDGTYRGVQPNLSTDEPAAGTDIGDEVFVGVRENESTTQRADTDEPGHEL